MWLEYFSQYMETAFPRFLSERPWNYKNDLCVTGAAMLADATGSPRWNRYILDAAKWLVDEEGRVANWKEYEHNIDKVSFGKSLRILRDLTGDGRYGRGVERAYAFLEHYPRTSTGNFWHKLIYPFQVWLDGLYMGQPFYMEYENRFNERKNYSDIMNQFNQARTLLYDEKTGLYYHAYDEYKDRKWADPETGLSPNFWLRSIGWYLMALVDCYELASEEIYEVKARFGELLREAVHGILKYQDKESKLFFQLPALPDQEGNYLETSGSLMVAYAVLKGCRLGALLEEKYAERGKEIYDAVLEQNIYQAEDGAYHLSGTCAVAGLGPRTERDGSIAYYLSEPVVDDDVKAVGVLMMVTAELMKMD